MNKRAPVADASPAATEVSRSAVRQRAVAIIESLGVSLPSKVVSSAEIVKGCRAGLNFPLEDYTGIRSRRVGGDEGTFAIDLARRAAERCLGTSRFAAGDVDLIVSCNISRYDAPGALSCEPGTSLQLKSDLGLDRAWAFDLANACAGVFTGIALADLLLRTGSVRNALVVSGEYITHLTETAQRELTDLNDPRMACLTLGDAGVALMLARSPSADAGFQWIELFTLGRYSRYCIARVSAAPEGGGIMLTDSVRLALVAAKEGVRQLTDFVQATGKGPEDFDYLITHQTSRTSLTSAMRALNRHYGREVYNDENVSHNLWERGNTASTSHFVALDDALRSGAVKPGDRILFSTVASGLVVGAASYTMGGPATTERADWGDDHRAIARTGSMRIESLAGVEPARGQAPETVALARSAAERCLRKSRHRRGAITELVFTGLYRNGLLTEPAVAALVAGELRLNETTVREPRTLAYDIVGGGPRFLTACRLAEQRMLTGADVAMVVASEVDVNAEHPTAAPLGVPPFGAAAILEWTDDPSAGFRRFLFRDFVALRRTTKTVGRMNGGPARIEVERSADWHQIYAECANAAIQDLLAAEHLSIAQIRCVLTSTASPAFDAALADALAIDRARVLSASLGVESHPTGSILHAMLAAQETDRIARGDLCVLVEAGAGVQIGCALYRI